MVDIKDCARTFIQDIGDANEKLKCEFCFAGYGLTSDDQCKKLPSNLKSNCMFYKSDGSCLTCMNGFKDSGFNDGNCIAYSYKGCLTHMSDKCTQCDTARDYYAVDVSAINGQICGYNSFILNLSLMVIGLLALL
jgi:hypothetical protein